MEPIPIAIINWNGLEDTKECITSVLASRNMEFKIYLLDNASAKNEYETLEELYQNEPVSVHQSETNLGFTGGSNLLFDLIFQESKSEYIVLLNNDTIVDELWLSELVSHAKTQDSHIVSSKMISYYNRDSMDNAGHMMLNTGEIIPIGHGRPKAEHDSTNTNMGACAGAALYSREMLEKIGLFDPTFSTGYEDAEMGLRAKVFGYKCTYCPTAIVYHKMGSSIRKIFNEDYSTMIQTSILYSYFKLLPKVNIIKALPSFLFKTLAMVVIDILFIRPKYLRVLFNSWKNVFKMRKKIRAERKKLASIQKISSTKISRELVFFLWFDIQRFWNIIILRKNSSIDSYSN